MNEIYGRRHDSIKEYLSSDIAALYDVDRWSKVTSNDIMLAAHSLLRYVLVDKLADAMGVPRRANLNVIPRSSPPVMGDRLQKVQRRPYHPLIV
jgi:hypothetical protein